MSDTPKDALLSPRQEDRSRSPSADSRANGKHDTEDSETVNLPVSPKAIGSRVPASDTTRDVKESGPTGPLPTSKPGTPRIREAEPPVSLPPFKITIEDVAKASSASDSGIHAPDVIVEDSESTLSEISSDYGETDSGSDFSDQEFKEIKNQIEEAVQSTSMAQFLEKMRYQIEGGPSIPEVEDFDLEMDEYMYEIDSKVQLKEGKVEEEEYNPALRKLHNMCWRILNTARLCSEHQRAVKDKRISDGIAYKFNRILQRVSLIDDDMQDMYINTLPALTDLRHIENLSSLFQHLTLSGEVTVMTEQVFDAANKDKILSHYNGFTSFRRDDFESMIKWQGRIDEIFVDRWMNLYPYVSVYCEETSSLKETFNNWLTVEMETAMMQTWNQGLRELAFAAQKLVLYLIPLLQDIRETLRGYYCIQKTLRNNLITFLNMDISEMFKLNNRDTFLDEAFVLS